MYNGGGKAYTNIASADVMGTAGVYNITTGQPVTSALSLEKAPSSNKSLID